MSKRAKVSGGRESTRADVATSGSAGAEPSKRLTRWEWILLALILAVGAWLRFSHLDLLEFQGDEAYAANLALEFVKHGKLPMAGLMSSVGVTNPPLFIYLLIPMFALSANPAVVSCCIAFLALAAVVVCWHVGRKYYGPVAGLAAAAFFAVSPWAVIYSRKIWAQDFVPIFATATMWAVHALVIGQAAEGGFLVCVAAAMRRADSFLRVGVDGGGAGDSGVVATEDRLAFCGGGTCRYDGDDDSVPAVQQAHRLGGFQTGDEHGRRRSTMGTIAGNNDRIR